MLQQSITDYNDAYTLMNDKGIKLYVERCRAVDSIANVESLINSIANHPKSFDSDFEEINTCRNQFTESCEFADREYLVLMPSAETTEQEWQCLRTAVETVPLREALHLRKPPLPVPERVLSVREAMLAPSRKTAVEQAVGRVLAENHCRDKVNLATKLPVWFVNTIEDVDKYFNEQLEKLQTDHFDFYLMHAMNKGSWAKQRDLGTVKRLEELQAEGRTGQSSSTLQKSAKPTRALLC